MSNTLIIPIHNDITIAPWYAQQWLLISAKIIFHDIPFASQTSINNNRGVLEMGIPKTMVEF